MNLPNYFFADLPPEAGLTPAMIEESCRVLKRNREKHLATHSVKDIVKLLDELGSDWRRADFPFRKFALEHGPAATGFSRATLARGLDSFFTELTAENLGALIEQDLSSVARLEKFSASGHGQNSNRTALVRGPELLVHIAAGNIPNPAFLGIILGLLVRSAQFVKCASGAAFLPRLFAHSIYDADKKLGGCLEVAGWRGGNEPLEAALFASADCVTATGSDEALAAIRSRLPLGRRFLGHGHKLSFAFVSSDAFGGGRLREIAGRAAADVTAWDQQGCLSPQVVYVEDKGPVAAEKFAELLAEELERCEQSEPRGEISGEEAAAIASRRRLYEVRAAHAPETTRHWCSRDSTAWTVVFEVDPRFQPSCLNRFIYVKPVADLAEALKGADAVREKVSTVGLAAPEHRVGELASQLAHWGVTRVCPLGRMQQPPITWRHDGRPALGDLVTWTDFEP